MKDKDKNIKESLNAMNPRLSREKRAMLWSDIQSRLQAPRVDQATQKSFWERIRPRAVAVALISALLFGTGSLTVAYADTAKPGDLLFPVDRATEKVALFFADSETKNELYVSHAKERFEEMEELVAETETRTEADGSGGDIAMTDTGSEDAAGDTEAQRKADVSIMSTQKAPPETTPASSSQKVQEKTPKSAQRIASEEAKTGSPNSIENIDENIMRKFAELELTFDSTVSELQERQVALEENGNTQAARAIEGVIKRMRDLAEFHKERVERLDARFESAAAHIKNSSRVEENMGHNEQEAQKQETKIRADTSATATSAPQATTSPSEKMDPDEGIEKRKKAKTKETESEETRNTSDDPREIQEARHIRESVRGRIEQQKKRILNERPSLRSRIREDTSLFGRD